MASSAGAEPELLIRLANLEVVRKPGRGPRFKPDPLAHPESAADALGLDHVSAQERDQLRELHRLVVELVASLLDGGPLHRLVGRLTALAAPSQARAGLAVTRAGELREQLLWSDPTLQSRLARRIAHELGTVDPARLRRCARPECDLVFYDTTKSNTQRWHAQSPCGQRERQGRFRASRRAEPGP